MTILVYDLATGEMVADGLAELPEAFNEGAQGWRDEPIGYPERIRWDQTLPGFVDTTPPVLARRFTFNQWVDLFSFSEQVAIVTAAMTDPVAKLIYDRAQSASGDIDPGDPRTLQGLGYLVSKGYVEQATLDRIEGL